MAESDNPLVDLRDKLSGFVTKVLSYDDRPVGKKNDPKYLDDMAKAANESFRKEAERKKLTADGPTLGGKKKTAKKTAKATARKKD